MKMVNKRVFLAFAVVQLSVSSATFVLALSATNRLPTTVNVESVLKNRFTGWLGVAGSVKYYEKTGRMLPLDDKAVTNDDLVESDF